MRISVIMPAYNAEGTIKNSLASVVNQDFGDWELIIVDDGSTDATLAIAQHASSNDPRIHVLRQENRGVSAARNAALESASGDIVIFLDADDELSAGFFVNVDSCMELRGIDVCLVEVDVRRGELAQYVLSCKIDAKDVLVDALSGRIGVEVWRMVFKRRVINTFALCFEEDISYGEDQLFSLKYLMCCRNAAVCEEAVYKYQSDNTHSAMRKLSSAQYEYVEAMRRFYDYCAMSTTAQQFDGLAVYIGKKGISSAYYTTLHLIMCGVAPADVASWLGSSSYRFFITKPAYHLTMFECLFRWLSESSITLAVRMVWIRARFRKVKTLKRC